MSREWPHFPDLHHLSGDDPSLHSPHSTGRQASQVLPPDLIIGDDPPLHSPSSHGKPAAFVIYSLSGERRLECEGDSDKFRRLSGDGDEFRRQCSDLMAGWVPGFSC